MKVPVIIYAAAVILLCSLQEEKVSAQFVAPSLYGGPLMYGSGDNDDDFGVLLALLMLASRNRGGNGCCCNSCNSCNNVRTVPVPYPIPFPTNNPIIIQGDKNDETSNTPSEVINIETENNQESIDETSIDNSPVNNVSSSSSSSTASNSKAGNNKPGKGQIKNKNVDKTTDDEK